ncbi:hypothetical protein [Pseudomonas syringae]|uniref:hypothetical protein n=1 Tax=Pseudomonas syringae TaxID=317 RepID=UPI001F24119B|nr:hypothetical protein [Pseudomonas syringae]MCF5701667.1 hypothetical protein [Pseudomonas syringae]
MNDVSNQVMSAAQRVALVKENNEFLVSQPLPISPRSAASISTLPLDKDELNAAIMGSGIAGFDASMSKRSKRIVKNTYMYADITSLLRFPAADQKEQRFQEFMKLLKLAGWFAFSQPYNRYQATSQSLKMDNVALSIIHTAVGAAVNKGQAGLKVLSTVADSTMEALKDEPEALALFENNSKKANGGNLCMTSSLEDADGDITMAVAAVHYTTKAQPTKVLFVEWVSSSVDIYNGAATMSISEEDYKDVEPLIVDALAKQRQKALSLEFGKKS